MALAGSQSSGPTRSSRRDEGQAPPRHVDASAVEDARRVRRVRDVLEALGADHRIDVRVTTRHTRTRRQSVLGCATIWIAREDADDPDPERLRGLVAHEYAHVIDAHRRRDRALTSGSAVLSPLAIVAMPAAQGLAVIVGGCLALSVAFMAWVSRRAEYRADARAADLLGSTHPVVAMLQRHDADAKPAVRTLAHRWMGALTHPAPERRIARLAGDTPRAP